MIKANFLQSRFERRILLLLLRIVLISSLFSLARPTESSSSSSSLSLFPKENASTATFTDQDPQRVLCPKHENSTTPTGKMPIAPSLPAFYSSSKGPSSPTVTNPSSSSIRPPPLSSTSPSVSTPASLPTDNVQNNDNNVDNEYDPPTMTPPSPSLMAPPMSGNLGPGITSPTKCPKPSTSTIAPGPIMAQPSSNTPSSPNMPTDVSPSAPLPTAPSINTPTSPNMPIITSPSAPFPTAPSINTPSSPNMPTITAPSISVPSPVMPQVMITPSPVTPPISVPPPIMPQVMITPSPVTPPISVPSPIMPPVMITPSPVTPPISVPSPIMPPVMITPSPVTPPTSPPAPRPVTPPTPIADPTSNGEEGDDVVNMPVVDGGGIESFRGNQPLSVDSSSSSVHLSPASTTGLVLAGAFVVLAALVATKWRRNSRAGRDGSNLSPQSSSSGEGGGKMCAGVSSGRQSGYWGHSVTESNADERSAAAAAAAAAGKGGSETFFRSPGLIQTDNAGVAVTTAQMVVPYENEEEIEHFYETDSEDNLGNELSDIHNPEDEDIPGSINNESIALECALSPPTNNNNGVVGESPRDFDEPTPMLAARSFNYSFMATPSNEWQSQQQSSIDVSLLDGDVEDGGQLMSYSHAQVTPSSFDDDGLMDESLLLMGI